MNDEIDRSVWLAVAKFRRFYRRSPLELPKPELIGPWLWLRKKLDAHLTVRPDGRRVPLDRADDFVSYALLTEESYDEAIEEFRRDGPEFYKAWLQRIRTYTAWMSSGDARKARSHSVVASFVGLFVSLTGLYPTKISALGLEFSGTSKSGFCIVLIAIIAYLAGAYNSMLRDYLIEAAALHLSHRSGNIYKSYQNRWARYIMLQQIEKSFYERKLPNVLALVSSVFLMISMVRSWWP